MHTLAALPLAVAAATPAPTPTPATTPAVGTRKNSGHATEAMRTAPTPVVAAGTGQTALVAAPARESQAGGTRTLSDVARERKLGKKGVQGGTLSVAGASGPQSGVAVAAKPTSAEIDQEAREADARLAKARTNGAWVDQNIHYNEQIRQDARREWDAAAENCRKTPGCKPVYRDSVKLDGHKPLRTDDENLAVYEKQLNNGDAPLPRRDREAGK